jgi:hypothetical protein
LTAIIGFGATAMAFHQDPRHASGQEPGVKETCTNEELAAQQAAAAQVRTPASGGDEYRKAETEALPDSRRGAKAIAGALKKDGTSSKRIDGTQVMKVANDDVKATRGNKLWKPTIGLLAFACLGFGGFVYVRNWAAKNAPDPTKLNRPRPESEPKIIA